MPPSVSRHRRSFLAALLALAALAPVVSRAVDRSRLAGANKDEFLTGDWGGRRSAWSAAGLDFAFAYTAAAYENLAGGLATGGTFEGTAELSGDLDLAKLAGWTDLRLHLSSVAAHGTSISTRCVGDVNKISSYYLDRGLYLNEVWLQKDWRQGTLTLRVGKMDADLEFPLYSYADAIPLPLYPTGALGVRLSYEPNSVWFLSAAVYDGNPNEPGHDNNPHGLHGFSLGRSEGATNLLMVGCNHDYGENAPLPPGTWKIGVYQSTRSYPNLATGAKEHGDFAYFLNGDQTLWRENPTVKDDAQGLALYLVAEWAPADRNTYHYGFGGGPYYTGLLPGRDKDLAYFNFLYTRFSPTYAAAARAAGGPGYGFENRWQFSYQIVFTKYFSLTPEIDYVVHPGGTGRLANATVLGLRTNLTF